MKILVIVIKMATEFNNSKFQFRSSKSVLANVVRGRLKLQILEELVVNMAHHGPPFDIMFLGIGTSTSIFFLI